MKMVYLKFQQEVDVFSIYMVGISASLRLAGGARGASPETAHSFGDERRFTSSSLIIHPLSNRSRLVPLYSTERGRCMTLAIPYERLVELTPREREIIKLLP